MEPGTDFIRALYPGKDHYKRYPKASAYINLPQRPPTGHFLLESYLISVLIDVFDLLIFNYY